MTEKVSLMQQFRNAQYSANTEAVTEIGTLLLSKNSENLLVLRPLARTLTETAQYGAAYPYWQKLHELEPEDIEPQYQLVAHGVRESGDSAAVVIDRLFPDQHPNIKAIFQRTLEEPLVNPEAREASRVLSICGVSFSGSTLLDRILGSLPGARSIGESHWLAKSYRNKVAGPIDFTTDSTAGVPQCSVCGHDCQVLNLPFRAQLSVNRTNWYQKIAERLDADLLINADKNAPKLAENDPLLRSDCLVLFKSPIQAWQSHVSKLPVDKEPEFYDEHLTKYLATWTRSYRIFLDDFRPTGKVVYLCFDEFTQNPETEFARITRLLNLPNDQSVLKHASQGHAIGGNSNAMKLIRNADYGININPLKPADIEDRHADIINADMQVNEVYKRLLAACSE